MIGRADIATRVREWGLREDVVEKDYVLGWTLWGIGSDPELSARWAFKGGTCLKKCYLETYRFSEDLDFTVLPGLVMAEDAIKAALTRVLGRVGDASGIHFGVRPPVLRLRPDGKSIEGSTNSASRSITDWRGICHRFSAQRAPGKSPSVIHVKRTGPTRCRSSAPALLPARQAIAAAGMVSGQGAAALVAR